ncbi:MAG TPA: hypothetical protein VFX21_07555, partial [Acidimicrobiia bacterium]|nr:hypothetical protein [Acidimicrobiia bacterium]
MAPSARGSRPALGAADVLIVAGAVALLVGTRFPFYELDNALSLEWSAWSNAWSLFPVALLGALYGCVPAAALVRARARRRPWTGTESGACVLLGVACLLTVLASWLRDVRLSTVVLATGPGAWMMFTGATASVAGSWLHYDAAVRDAPPDRPPVRSHVGPAVLVVWLGAAVVLVASFLTVFELPTVGGETVAASAWSRNFSPPLFLLPVVWALLLAALVSIPLLPRRLRPRTILAVERTDVEFGLSAIAVVTMVGLTVGVPGFRAF